MFIEKECENTIEKQLRQYKNKFAFNESLVIETYVVGSKKQGESIVIIIKADAKVCFSGVVDSCKNQCFDKVKDILAFNHIKELDFICWSHPDLDHSYGIDDFIKDYSSERTNIWFPEGLENSNQDYCKKSVDILKQVKKYCINKHINIDSISDNKNLMYYNSICFIKDSCDLYPLEIKSFAPSSRILRMENYTDSLIKNNQSIFFELFLGKAKIWFTGDVLNQTLQVIKDAFDKEQNIHILKIPHHGSTGSCEIMVLFDKCDVACSTVYRVGNNNLPNAETMELYKKKSENLYCTGHKDCMSEKENFGVVKIVTNVIQEEYKIETEGNATKWLF